MTGAGPHKTFLSRPLRDDQAKAISTTVGQGKPEFARQSTGKCKRCLTNDISGMQRAKLFTWKPQLNAPERAAMRCAGKARRRCGLMPARRSNAASAPQRGLIGRVALSPTR